MTARSWELLLKLLSRPEACQTPVVPHMTRQILRDEVLGEKLLSTLAEQSTAHARQVLAWAEDSLPYWDYKELEKVIDAVEERIKGQKLSMASDEELQARATLHILTPANAEGMPLRTRVLAWALLERQPELAASVLLHVADDEEFWEDCVPLRRSLVPKLRDSSPHLTVPMLSHHCEALDWLHHLLEATPYNQELFTAVLEALKTNHYWHGVTWEMLLALTHKALDSKIPCTDTLLTYMTDWLRSGSSKKGSARIIEFFELCQKVPPEQRRELGEKLRSDVASMLPRPDRRFFLRKLAHWLRPALLGPEDSLQRDLQADRAGALLMHLSIRRLAKAHLWQMDLASRQRRRFMRRRNSLWQTYTQHRKAVMELAATLEAIACQKSDS